jgi:hypothetical protein
MPRISPTVKQILIALVAAFVLQVVLENWLDVRVFGWLAMSPGELMPWQLFTYVLVDRNHPVMFLIGLLFIAWALSTFELTFGRTRTLQLCVFAALAASIPAWLLGLVVTGAPPLFGANPLWYGSIAAITWLDRHRPMSLFGVLPMTAQQFLLLLLGISTLMFLTTKNETAFVGDLGALAGGIAMANWLRKPRKPKKPPERKKARASGFKVIPGGQDDRNLLH